MISESMTQRAGQRLAIKRGKRGEMWAFVAGLVAAVAGLWWVNQGE